MPKKSRKPASAKKTVLMTWRCEPGLARDIRQAAEQDGRTPSSFIHNTMKQRLQQRAAAGGNT